MMFAFQKITWPSLGKQFIVAMLVHISSTSVTDDVTPRSFHGDHVFRIDVPSSEVWRAVQHLLNHPSYSQALDLWKPPDTLGTCDVHVRSHFVSHFRRHLASSNITHTILMDDVQSLVEQQKSVRHKRSISHHNVIGKYAPLDEMSRWLHKLRRKHPESVKLLTIGHTYEGRPLTVVKVGLAGGAGARPAVWLDAGFHAREWISHSTALYIIHKLARGIRNESSPAHRLLQSLDFYILPVANPDGYAYTFSMDRLWRKNRRPVSKNCTGVDINRNFRFQWGEGHTSADPCSIMYHGPAPDSELETRHVERFLKAHAGHVLAYVSLHAYMQHVYTRYDYARARYPTDHQQLILMAQKAAEAIMAENGSLYHVGTAADILYSYGGGSADWAKAVAGIKYSYLIELRDSGQHGFLLPTDQIIPTGEETWAGLRAIGKELISLYNISAGQSGDKRVVESETQTTEAATWAHKDKPEIDIEVVIAQWNEDGFGRKSQDLQIDKSDVNVHGASPSSDTVSDTAAASAVDIHNTCILVTLIYCGLSTLVAHSYVISTWLGKV